jgi:Mlc titration factor MtfA (ptsG expression regulator)
LCYKESMFHWFRDHRRKKLLETPFPAEWEKSLLKNMAHYTRLTEAEQKHLRDLVQVFVAEKNWEGCGGLELTEEIQVTIAGEACLLTLALPYDVYPNVESIFVYPSTVVLPHRHAGVFESPHAEVETETAILGEAMLKGPVILVWDSVKQNGRHPEFGHNVVYHEFAHKLDMLTGQADGTPPLKDAAETRAWVKALEPEFLRLKEMSSRGQPTFLDHYGATNEAEFFAVVTEQFFDQGKQMQVLHPELYRVLKAFYRQDPALR